MHIRMSRLVWCVAILVAACTAVGCKDDDETQTLPPTPAPTAAQNPCPASNVARDLAGAAASPSRSKGAGRVVHGDPRGMLGDVLWRHRAGASLRTASAGVTSLVTEDVGEVAVIQDEGDVITPANTVDLQLSGLRYTPKSGGGYDVSRTDAGFRAALGDAVTLADDDSVSRNVPFTFNFYGQPQALAWVNSDGNITFGVRDTAITSRDISRLLSGAPRVAVFFADLDPSSGGTVYVRAAADAFTATWCGVRVFDSTRQVTVQASFFPDGTIEMKYAGSPTLTAVDGIVGVSPGRTDTFMPVDLSTSANRTITGGSGAVGERFSLRPDLDLVALSRKFYRTHSDRFDQLVVWTDEVMTPEDAFSFEVTVANDIDGIGQDRYDFSGEFGSNDLTSVVQMDSISKFPDDPATKFLGENNTLSVLGQEVGHRWLAFLHFSDHNRQDSGALLGRDEAHWSFFFNSDASVMEGNRIQDLGGGMFRTTGAVERYSVLDQYAMGLVRDIDVPSMFYVENPTAPGISAESGPRVGVTFSGTRRDVLINDVIEVMGARQPSSANSPRVFRQAFLFVVGRGRTAAPAAISKIDRIRRAWEPFFMRAVDNRARVETRLNPGT